MMQTDFNFKINLLKNLLEITEGKNIWKEHEDILDNGNGSTLFNFEENGQLKDEAIIYDSENGQEALNDLLGTLLRSAVKNNQLDKISQYGNYIAEFINVPDGNHWTPLHHAAIRGHHQMVEYLINAGAGLEAKTVSGRTALSWAIENNHFDSVCLLIKAGAKAEPPCEIFELAVKHAGLPIIKFLIENGVNPLDSDALRLAAERTDDPEILKLLIQNNHATNINIEKSKGNALHAAVGKFGNQEILGQLFQQNANPNLVNEDGNTPLHLAVIGTKNNEAAVRLLLAQGAEVNKKNKNNKTPLDLSTDRINKSPRYGYHECYTKSNLFLHLAAGSETSRPIYFLLEDEAKILNENAQKNLMDKNGIILIKSANVYKYKMRCNGKYIEGPYACPVEVFLDNSEKSIVSKKVPGLVQAIQGTIKKLVEQILVEQIQEEHKKVIEKEESQYKTLVQKIQNILSFSSFWKEQGKSIFGNKIPKRIQSLQNKWKQQIECLPTAKEQWEKIQDITNDRNGGLSFFKKNEDIQAQVYQAIKANNFDLLIKIERHINNNSTDNVDKKHLISFENSSNTKDSNNQSEINLSSQQQNPPPPFNPEVIDQNLNQLNPPPPFNPNYDRQDNNQQINIGNSKFNVFAKSNNIQNKPIIDSEFKTKMNSQENFSDRLNNIMTDLNHIISHSEKNNSLWLDAKIIFSNYENVRNKPGYSCKISYELMDSPSNIITDTREPKVSYDKETLLKWFEQSNGKHPTNGTYFEPIKGSYASYVKENPTLQDLIHEDIVDLEEKTLSLIEQYKQQINPQLYSSFVSN